MGLVLWLGIYHPGSSQPTVIVSKGLAQKINTYPDSLFAIGLIFEQQIDFFQLENQFRKQDATLSQRSQIVIDTLQQQARKTQTSFLPQLTNVTGIQPASIRPLWINNAIFLRANKAAIDTLQTFGSLAYILEDASVEVEHHISEPGTYVSVAGIETGLKRIQAPAMWDMGYTGYGQLALNIDTGVDSSHPALRDRYWGRHVPNSQAWFDGDLGTQRPSFCDDHGTHVTGTMLGLDPYGQDTIGVAFGASWMGSPAICDGLSSDNLATFQWALNPDGDLGTSEDMPDVINNSWRATDVDDECTHPVYGPALDALEAAGIAVVFSAGNSGPAAASITPPKNLNHSLVNTFTVAAVNGIASELNLLGFSSRGPSTCPASGSLAIKPEVAAPGFQVRSSIRGGVYGLKSGTSMAAPHVSGAILLLKEAFPNLTGTDVKRALYFTCVDLGEEGEDNEYGMGLIDVYAAFQYLVNAGHVPTVVSDEYDPAIVHIRSIPGISCDSIVRPEIELRNNGTQLLTALALQYRYSTGLGGTVSWTGQLGTDSSAMLQLPAVILPSGQHSLNISISDINSGESDYHDLDNEYRLSFLIVSDPLSTKPIVEVCEGSDGLLSGSSQSAGEVKWYASANSGEVLSEGNSWFLSKPDASETYYAAWFFQNLVGKRQDSQGTAGYDPETEGSLIFHSWQPFTLRSVLLHSQADGYRTIELTDHAGQVVEEHTEFLNIGSHRVQLDFEMPSGTNWELGLRDQGHLFRHVTGGSYPYSVPGIMSIERSSQGRDSYFYFYDWEIEYESPCDRHEVRVEILPGEMMTRFVVDSSNISQLNQGIISFIDQSNQATEWLWDFGDGQTGNAQHPIHTYQDTGRYIVQLFARGQDGCGDAFSTTIRIDSVLTTGILLESEADWMTLFPNPVKDYLSLHLLEIHQDKIELILYDIHGRARVRSAILPGQRKKMIDLHEIPNGIYILHIQSSTQSVTQRIVKRS